MVSVHRPPQHLSFDNQSSSNPGKPWQNGIDESFNGKFRDDTHMFAFANFRLDKNGVAFSSLYVSVSRRVPHDRAKPRPASRDGVSPTLGTLRGSPRRNESPHPERLTAVLRLVPGAALAPIRCVNDGHL